MQEVPGGLRGSLGGVGTLPPPPGVLGSPRPVWGGHWGPPSPTHLHRGFPTGGGAGWTVAQAQAGLGGGGPGRRLGEPQNLGGWDWGEQGWGGAGCGPTPPPRTTPPGRSKLISHCGQDHTPHLAPPPGGSPTPAEQHLPWLKPRPQPAPTSFWVFSPPLRPDPTHHQSPPQAPPTSTELRPDTTPTALPSCAHPPTPALSGSAPSPSGPAPTPAPPTCRRCGSAPSSSSSSSRRARESCPRGPPGPPSSSPACAPPADSLWAGPGRGQQGGAERAGGWGEGKRDAGDDGDRPWGCGGR